MHFVISPSSQVCGKRKGNGRAPIEGEDTKRLNLMPWEKARAKIRFSNALASNIAASIARMG